MFYFMIDFNKVAYVRYLGEVDIFHVCANNFCLLITE